LTPDVRSLFQLREDVVYLNHGSYGACPRPVFERYQELQRELEAEPVDFLHTRRTLCGRLAAVRSRLAGFLGADRDEIVMVPNTTTGLNIVARSLRLDPGDEVLACDHEYGAMDRMWRFLCAKQQARYVRRPLPLPLADPDAVIEAVWSGVTDRTRVLFLSHITSASGAILPVKPLIDRARRRGILTMIDGAHVPGQIDCDLHALGCDFWAGNCHKWLMGPKSAAALYVRRDMQDLVEPLVVSWGWESDWPGPSRFVDEHEWTGTQDFSAYLAVPAALDFFAAHDWPAVRRRCRALLLEARERILSLTGLEPLCPADPWLAQMAALPLATGTDGEALQHSLRHDHSIEIPVTTFADRPWLRVSVQGYNTSADIDRLVATLEEILS